MPKDALQVLVIGGAGFIGGHLVRTLVAEGHSVRVLDDLSLGLRSRLGGLAVEFLETGIDNLTAVQQAISGVDVVFQLAGRPAPLGLSAEELSRADEVNRGGMINLLEAARREKPKRIVVAGSGDVYGRAAAYLLHEEVGPWPATPEAVQHLAAEHLARVYWQEYGVPTVVLRLFETFGPGEAHPSLVRDLCRAAATGVAPVVEGEAHHTRDLVYVDNVVAALLAAGQAVGVEGTVLNIASGEAVSLAALWTMLCDLAGLERQALRPTYVAPAHWRQATARVSIARASRLLAYAPAVRLREGLRRTYEGFLVGWRAGENSWFTPLAGASSSSIPPPLPGLSSSDERGNADDDEMAVEIGQIIQVEDLRGGLAAGPDRRARRRR